jgi:hypothetical protein
MVRPSFAAAPLFDLDLHVQLPANCQVGDYVCRIDDLDVVGSLDVACGNHALALLAQIEHRFVAVVQLEYDALEVEQQVDNVFLHPVDGRILMQHAADVDFGGCEARHRRQENATQGVAQRVAVTPLERFHGYLGVELAQALYVDDARFEKSTALHRVCLYRNELFAVALSPTRQLLAGLAETENTILPLLLRIQFHHQGFVDRGRQIGALRRGFEHPFHGLGIRLEPFREPALLGRLDCALDA